MISTETLSSIVVPYATEVVLERYNRVPLLANALTTVQDLTIDKIFGHKLEILEGAGALKPREDGQNIEVDDPGVVGIAQARTRQYARGLQISARDAQAIIGLGKVPDYMTQQIRSFGDNAINAKNADLTAHYERGVIAAGDKSVFVRSYKGNPATYEGKIYDNKAWFATDHPLRGSLPSVSNITTSAVLSESTFEAARVKFSQAMALDHRGQRISLVPNFIMVPPALESLAQRIVGSPQLQGTPNNDINPNFGRFQVIVNPFMSSSTGWFLGNNEHGLEFYDSGAPEVEMDYDAKTKTWLLSVETRWLPIPTDWRHAVANNFATS